MSHQDEYILPSSLRVSTRTLLWVVGVIALTAALLYLVGGDVIGWILLIAGVGILVLAMYQTVRDPAVGKPLRERISQADPRTKLLAVGSFFVVIGLLARFGPFDVALGLVGVGILVFLVLLVFVTQGGVRLGVTRRPPRTAGQPGSNGVGKDMSEAHVLEKGTSDEVDGFTELSVDFREHVASTLFAHARRVSQTNFVVGFVLYLSAIGLIGLLVFSIYKLVIPGQGDSPLSNLLSVTINRIMQASLGASSPEEMVINVAVAALAGVFPIAAWILMGWLSLRLISSAKSISQRRVIQETLAELGPLLSTMVGLPPRKAFQQVSDQSLLHARRSFTTRLWLSITLFGVGIALVLATILYAFVEGLQDLPSWLTAGVLGGGSILSFIVGAVTGRQSELRRALTDISTQEREVALAAQRAEVADLLVTAIIHGKAESLDVDRVRGVLELVDSLLLGKVAPVSDKGTSLPPPAHPAPPVGSVPPTPPAPFASPAPPVGTPS